MHFALRLAAARNPIWFASSSCPVGPMTWPRSNASPRSPRSWENVERVDVLRVSDGPFQMEKLKMEYALNRPSRPRGK